MRSKGFSADRFTGASGSDFLAVPKSELDDIGGSLIKSKFGED